jgi:hypothetical protein
MALPEREPVRTPAGVMSVDTETTRSVAQQDSEPRREEVQRELEPEPGTSPNEALRPSGPHRAMPVRTPRKSEPKPDEPPMPAGIGQEIDLVKQAGRALAAGDHARALRVLDEHAREFPDGALTEDRSALRVLALCAAGRVDEGSRAKQAFADRWPRSVHADRLEDGCRSINTSD